MLYLILPLTPLLVALGLTFTSALVIGLRPIIGPTATWIVVGVVIAANIWMGRTLLGTVLGWQLFWIENDILVVCAAVTTANLYVQGGMRLRHVAWFGLVLAIYDAVFTFVWPVTNTLAQRFIGWPFDPSVGFRIGIYNATIGLGDLLVYGLFVIAALKAYGPRAARSAAIIAVLLRCGGAGAAPRPHRRVHRRTDRRHRAGAGGVRTGGLPVLPVAAAHATAPSAPWRASSVSSRSTARRRRHWQRACRDDDGGRVVAAALGDGRAGRRGARRRAVARTDRAGHVAGEPAPEHGSRPGAMSTDRRPARVAWVLIVLGALVAAWPVRPSVSGDMVVAHVSGMLAGYGAVVLVALMSRWPVIERALGADELARWHARGGRLVMALIVTHACAAVAVWARLRGIDAWSALIEVVRMPGVAAAVVAVLLLLAVAGTSSAAPGAGSGTRPGTASTW